MNFNNPMPGAPGLIGASSAPGAFSPYQGAQRGAFDMDAPAVLVIFQPNRAHRLGVQAHRPLLYNFDQAFVSATQEVVHRTQSSSGGMHLGVVDSILSTPQARMSITAAPTPDTFINFNPITDWYRFMLIINRAKAPSHSGVQAYTPLVKHRVVMNGYFLDSEPMSMMGTLNPNAVMVFTHKSVFEVMSAVTPNGTNPTSLTTRLDQNFVNHSLPSLSNDPNLFYIDPHHSYDATYSNMGGQSIVAPGHQQKVGYNQVNKALDSKLESPMHNLRHLVGNVISARREVGDRPHMAHMYAESRINLPSHNLETFQEVLARNLQGSGNTAALLGPTEHDTKLLGALDAEYGGLLNVQMVESDQTGSFMTLDQSQNIYTNVANSLIASAAPTTMAASALARLDFWYESNFAANDPLNDYNFRLDYVIPFMPMAQGMLNQRVHAVMNELSRGVFRSVYEGASRTDFVLSGSIDLGGLTNLNLHIKDGSPRIAEPYQHPTIYGGMMTPLFGTAMMSAHNGSQIASFVDELSGAGMVNEVLDNNHIIDPGMEVTPGTNPFPELSI